jgi:prepilin-type N-terminal cleavage/methylation domain-containing protein
MAVAVGSSMNMPKSVARTNPGVRVRGQSRGFTLPELLLTLAVIAIMVGTGAAVFLGYERRNALDNAAAVIVENLRRASVLAEAMADDASWGVAINGGNVTLFRGTSFATRNQNFDEMFELGSAIAHTGLAEVIFAKTTGLPETSGSMTLTTNTNAARTITINTQGMVAF